MPVRYGAHDRFYWTKQYALGLHEEIVESMSVVLWPYVRALQELADMMDSIGLVVDDIHPSNFLEARVRLVGGSNPRPWDDSHDDSEKRAQMFVQSSRGYVGITRSGENRIEYRGGGDYLHNWTEKGEESAKYALEVLKSAIANLAEYIERYAGGRNVFEDPDEYMQKMIDMGVIRNLDRISVYLGVDEDGKRASYGNRQRGGRGR
jgi:hypothetical protein